MWDECQCYWIGSATQMHYSYTFIHYQKRRGLAYLVFSVTHLDNVFWNKTGISGVIVSRIRSPRFTLTYCGQMIPYGDIRYIWINIDSGNGSAHQAITATNVDFSTIGFCGMHLRSISQEVLTKSIRKNSHELQKYYRFCRRCIACSWNLPMFPRATQQGHECLCFMSQYSGFCFIAPHCIDGHYVL